MVDIGMEKFQKEPLLKRVVYSKTVTGTVIKEGGRGHDSGGKTVQGSIGIRAGYGLLVKLLIF